MQRSLSKQNYNDIGFTTKQSPYLNDYAFSAENLEHKDEYFANGNSYIQQQPNQINQDTFDQLESLVHQQENIDASNFNIQNDKRPYSAVQDISMNQAGNISYGQAQSNIDISQKNMRSSGMSNRSQTSLITGNKKAYSPTSKFEQFEKFDPSYAFYESPGKPKPLISKTSKAIMKRVFDEEFSLESQSQKRQMEKTMNDFSKFNRSMTSAMEGLSTQRVPENESKPSDIFNIDYQYLEICQKNYFQNINADGEKVPETLDEQLNMTFQNFTTSDQRTRIGAILTLFELIYQNDNLIQSTQATEILTCLFEQLPSFYDNQDFYMELITLEIISN